ncbi:MULTISPECIES: hypothetical protein [Rhizobium/Agrobacterium group]|nr:hypothetical protein [Rhizobium rhizogenes]
MDKLMWRRSSCPAVLENSLDDRPEDARAAVVDAADEALLSFSPDDDLDF